MGAIRNSRATWLSAFVALLAGILVGCGESESSESSGKSEAAGTQAKASAPAKTQLEAEHFFAKEAIAEYIEDFDLSTVKLSGCKPAEDPSKWECAMWGKAVDSRPLTGGEELHAGECLFVSAEVGHHIEGENSEALSFACEHDFGLGKAGKKPNATELAGWHHFATEINKIATEKENEEQSEQSQAESETAH